MKNIDIIQKFVNGATKGQVGNLQIDGQKLFNYHTVIAERSPIGFILNVTKYSMSTSRIQNMLRKELVGCQVKEIGDIRQGFYNSLFAESQKF